MTICLLENQLHFIVIPCNSDEELTSSSSYPMKNFVVNVLYLIKRIKMPFQFKNFYATVDSDINSIGFLLQ